LIISVILWFNLDYAIGFVMRFKMTKLPMYEVFLSLIKRLSPIPGLKGTR